MTDGKRYCKTRVKVFQQKWVACRVALIFLKKASSQQFSKQSFCFRLQHALTPATRKIFAMIRRRNRRYQAPPEFMMLGFSKQVQTWINEVHAALIQENSHSLRHFVSQFSCVLSFSFLWIFYFLPITMLFYTFFFSLLYTFLRLFSL